MISRAIIAAIIAAPACAGPVINCDDAAAYQRIFKLSYSVMGAVAADCAKNQNQTACVALALEFSKDAPPPDNAAKFGAFIAFLRAQCPDIQTDLPEP